MVEKTDRTSLPNYCLTFAEQNEFVLSLECNPFGFEGNHWILNGTAVRTGRTNYDCQMPIKKVFKL